METYSQLLRSLRELSTHPDPNESREKLIAEILSKAKVIFGADRAFHFENEDEIPEEILAIIKETQKNRQISLTEAVIESKPRSILTDGTFYLDVSTGQKTFDDEELIRFEIFSLYVTKLIQIYNMQNELVEYHTKFEAISDQLATVSRDVKGQLSFQEHELARMRVELQKTYSYKNIVGKSKGMQEILAQLDAIITSDKPILIMGEEGTGKELLAKTIHYNSSRREAGFFSENCALIAPPVVEDEIDKLLKLAEEGTLYLENVDALIPKIQKVILKSIVGKNIRIMASTGKNLANLSKEGFFDKGFLKYIESFRLFLPALRERGDDILLLINHFLGQIAQEQGAQLKVMSQKSRNLILKYNWPGNVQELSREIRKAASMSQQIIGEEQISEKIKSPQPTAGMMNPSQWEGRSLDEALSLVEQEMIRSTLDKAKGNKAKTAKLLKISRTTLYEKLDKN